MTKSMKNLKGTLPLVFGITYTFDDDNKILTIITHKTYNDKVWKLRKYNHISMNYGWIVKVIRDDGKI